MKSPLRDPYGFKSARILKQLFPEKSIVESYLLYAGEMELNLAASDRLVIAHTQKYPVYEFWLMITKDAPRVAGMATSVLRDYPERMLRVCQNNWHQVRDPVLRSALFYVLSRTSSLHRPSCGEINKSTLSLHALQKLKRLQVNNFHLLLDKFEDFHTTVNAQIKSDFKFFPMGHYRPLLLDGGAMGDIDMSFVDHERFWKFLRNAPYRWVMLYKFHSQLLKAFGDYRVLLVDKYGNLTENITQCEDIIVTNF